MICAVSVHKNICYAIISIQEWNRWNEKKIDCLCQCQVHKCERISTFLSLHLSTLTTLCLFQLCHGNERSWRERKPSIRTNGWNEWMYFAIHEQKTWLEHRILYMNLCVWKSERTRALRIWHGYSTIIISKRMHVSVFQFNVKKSVYNFDMLSYEHNNTKNKSNERKLSLSLPILFHCCYSVPVNIFHTI